MSWGIGFDNIFGWSFVFLRCIESDDEEVFRWVVFEKLLILDWFYIIIL